MRLLTSTFVFCATACAGSFHIPGADPGSWPRVLSSVGLQAQGVEDSRVIVLRAGAPASPDWMARVERGAMLVLEGESPAAESFGFRGGKERVRVASLIDARRPKLPIIWEKAADLPRFDLPPGARVFAKERWSGAPLLAGLRRGAGAVLWIAATPGDKGYERFPYVLHALADLGLEAPVRSARLWAFFDYSYRTRVDLDYFASRWRSAGIAALHVAAWHFFEADPERDIYLRNLIEACHRKGILVYAWIELPHVSEKFWNDHPAWREKTGVLQDAHLDWRKLMNLQNRDCFRAAAAGVHALIGRFDWDGVNLAELYFESLEGASNPSRFTPLNDDVRAEFRRRGGFDPVELWSTRKDAASLRAFLDFRAGLAQSMQQQWLAEIEKARATRRNLDLVLTHVDDRFDAGMKDAIGADAARVLPLLDLHDFTFLIEDPATVWNLGPERYPEIARRYQPLTPHAAKLAIDINVVDRYQDVYPTKQQTGTELFQLVHLASAAFPRVALYFENSLLTPDLPLLASAAASAGRFERIGDKLTVDSARGLGVAWKGPARVDGRPWPVASDSVVWLPPGTHSIEPAPAHPPLRILDFTGDLEAADSPEGGGARLWYQSASRAIAVVERRPLRVEVDGLEIAINVLPSGGYWALLLPRGKHMVKIQD